MHNKFVNYLTPHNLEEQEHLSIDYINDFIVDKPIDQETIKERPTSNFIELMNWAENSFRHNLKDLYNINKFVHNRILIDGQFLRFCQENKISIECLYKDSMISWKSDHNFEKFFIQGVFLIKTKDVEFIQASLFYKGNMYEDEIGFFVIASENNYQSYIELRNKFDAWIQERDRSNSHIRVIGGEDIVYTKDNSWDDLFLPNNIKTEIKTLVENFLTQQDFYIQNKIPWKRGILLFGKAGNGKTSIIRTIMSEYNFKPITIAPGANDEDVREAFSYAEEQSPSLLYFEDLDSLLEKSVDISSFLNLMDGVAAKNGMLVVATANEVKKLKPSITGRPQRFDRKYEIPLPDQKMSHAYLKKWFGKLITDAKCKAVAKNAAKYEFSYAYLKELYISAMFEALANNRKNPTSGDIDKALDRITKDKNLLNGRKININKYTQ